MKSFIKTGLLAFLVILQMPMQAKADYWFENTFTRSSWVKENCVKLTSGQISTNEAMKRLNVPTWEGLPALCQAYGAWR